MTLEEMVKTWDEESQAANDCIVEILESYMEVLNLFEATMKRDTISPKIKQMALTLCNQRKKQWGKILEHAKKANEIAKKVDSHGQK